MSDDSKLTRMIEQAYEERKTDCIRKEELISWLERNGLKSEEASEVIGLAVNRRVIRFCYSSSMGKGKLIPCYERISEEDQLPPELDEELLRRAIQKDGKMVKTRVSKRRTKRNHDGDYARKP